MHTTTHSFPSAAAQPELDFALLVGPAWQQLSPAIRKRFAAGHGNVAYRGSLQLHSSPMGRVFGAIARLFGSPLAARRKQRVPATVKVLSDGHGGVIWERHLGEADQADSQCVRSTKRLGPDGGLDECTDGGLSMRLEVCVEGAALVFYSRYYFFLLGRWRLRVPSLLTPGVCRVEHRDEGPGCFRFTLDMKHSFWGHTFHQTGVFHDPKES